MDIKPPPEMPAFNMDYKSGTLNVVRVPAPRSVLVLTPDGKIMRGDRELHDLDRDELIEVVRDLVDVIARPRR